MIPLGDDAQARNAVMGGHVDLGTMSLVAANNFRDSLNILGTMSAERMDFAPDVPTFREQGYDIVGGALRIFVAPPGLPDDIKDILVAAVEQAVTDPEFKAEADKTFSFVDHLGPAEIENVIEQEERILRELWAESPWVE
jgi:tripartite-type tricarboxylate transporter receptor subunit TctC